MLSHQTIYTPHKKAHSHTSYHVSRVGWVVRAEHDYIVHFGIFIHPLALKISIYTFFHHHHQPFQTNQNMNLLLPSFEMVIFWINGEGENYDSLKILFLENYHFDSLKFLPKTTRLGNVFFLTDYSINFNLQTCLNTF